jgi:hypothetical protein
MCFSMTASQGMRAEMRADSGEGDTIWRPGGGIGGRGRAAGSPGEWPDKCSPSLAVSLSRKSRERKRSLSVSRSLSRRARALALALDLSGGARAKDKFASWGFDMAHFGVRTEIT